MKEKTDIIIYVVSRYTRGDLTNYVLDFRLMDDYYLFRQSMGDRIQDILNIEDLSPAISIIPSLLFLRNIPSRHKFAIFREDSYYRLNIKALLDAQFIQPQGEDLFIGTFDFSGSDFVNEEDLPLLPKTEPLSSGDLKVFPNETVPRLLQQNLPNKITIKVRDVGQGNWNEVLFDDEYIIVYDIGTYLRADRSTRRTRVMERYAEYKKSKPLLILSHWDVDHINCLTEFGITELKECFCGVCCMNKLRSLMSTQIYGKLQIAFGHKLNCYTPCDKTITDSKRRQPINNNAYIYIGRQSRSTNYSGLSLVVRNDNGSALLTGDIKLEQAFTIYHLERVFSLGSQRHMLVAPHHGGRYPSGRKDYADPTALVAISVGLQNTYGHPEARMLQLYQARSYGNVHRTDLRGECIFEF